tara:strand:- start:46 stop:246 length:201 start_codon:yes stop_codon:yes gene_type:complete
MVSPNKNQVKTGNTMKPVAEPTNLDDQTESKPAVVNLHAYQNMMLVGTPKQIADVIGLFFHHSYRY